MLPCVCKTDFFKFSSDPFRAQKVSLHNEKCCCKFFQSDIVGQRAPYSEGAPIGTMHSYEKHIVPQSVRFSSERLNNGRQE